MMVDFQYELDARGKRCPTPVKETKKLLHKMSRNDVLHIMATDPTSEQDLAILLGVIKDELLESCRENGVYHYYIRKK